MTKQIPHLPATTTAAEVSNLLRAHGAVIVDNLVTPEAIDTVLDEMMPFIENTALGPDSFTGRNTARTGALIARSEAARGLVTHPLALGAAQELLGAAHRFQLHLTQIISIGPNEPAQPVHRDEWAFDFFPFPSDYHVQCNTMWAMTDFTEENGATRVLLDSQDLPAKTDRTHEGTVGASMSKGSVLFYTGKAYHSGGANNSDKVRRGANITYCASWVRQEENQYLSCPPDIARELSDDLLRLMGYARGAYALGYVGDLADPISVIREGAGATGLGDPVRP